MADISRILDLMTEGDPFCLITVISSTRPDVPIGLKAVALRDGTLEEDAGPARWDPALRALAMEALTAKKSRTVEVEAGVLAFLEVISSEVKLLICGAGHIALPLARFAREAGFSVAVLDDRPDFANSSRFPGCEVIAEGFITALRKMPLSPSAYVVVITRGHEHDEECLTEILPKATAYVGLIGSRRRGSAVLEALGKKGIPSARLTEVFTPIGLPIGAESPEEIALSITAELVCIKRSGFSAARALRDASVCGK